MVRKRKKKSLYEVIANARLKSSDDEALGQPPPEKSDKKDGSSAAKSTLPMSERLAQWPKKPKIIQFNAGRIEISIPYHLAIALLLGIVLLVLVVFRLGQITYVSKQKAANSAERIPESKQEVAEEAAVSIPQTAPATQKTSPGVSAPAEKVEPAEAKGDHVIVLVEYQVSADLVPVREHFARYGIETEIVRERGRYFLITKNRYENPERPETDGYKAKQRIIEVGARYKGKAPEGYETFAPHFFKDAYGKKVR